LLDLHSERYFGLNAVGARMWELLAADVSIGAIPALIAKEFRADPERIQDDLAALVADLLQAGLVQQV
jgi:hypothetical protein